jgi:peptide/nickel transport system permease protein
MSAPTGFMAETFARLRKDPLGLSGLVIVVVILLATIFASVLAPHDPLEVDVYNRLLSPTWQHWLGTDQLGRDILSRVLFGGRIALKVAVVAISVSMAAGLLLCMLAGFGPSWLDRLLGVCFDTHRGAYRPVTQYRDRGNNYHVHPGLCTHRANPNQGFTRS